MAERRNRVRKPANIGAGVAIEYIERAIRRSRKLAVILVFVHDIDRLCATVGHVRAGEALSDVHTGLSELARDRGAVMQLSDRKFALLLSGFRNRGHVRLAAQKIMRLIRSSINQHSSEQKAHVTIGIVLGAEQNGDAHELLRSAEFALLDGRRKNEPVSFFETSAAEQIVTDWGLEQRLADALEAGDLEMYYQPKLSLENNEAMSAEALMRWHDPEIGEISPEIFVNAAETSGLITDLTHFSIQRACRQLSQWHDSLAACSVAVNITPSIIRNLEIVDVLESACGLWNIDPGAIMLEVTENALMIDPEASHAVLTRIRDFGAKVSIDDFGTGYSSLAYLKEIPADELKIDRSFVMGMLSDSGDHKIVEHSIAIAKSFGLRVVAEGVEDADTLRELQSLHCDFVQGYHICKPLPAGDLLAWFNNLKSRPTH